MRYALISDIHANLPALEAVLASIQARGDVDATYHLGDLVGYAPWPNETADAIRAAGIAGVGGIHFVNTGSVGRPKDGDWRAGYVVLSMDDGVDAEFVRVDYDVEQTMEAIRRSELPDEFAEYLRTGGKPAYAGGAA